jgi:SSS family solute:Na+ symporter
MNLHWIDWTIVGLVLAGVIGLTVYSKRYTRSVAGFLSANRQGGRYLIALNCGVLGGAISIVALWEMLYNSGLPTQWWPLMNIPLNLFILLSGFVVYRYRQTRALTIAQFFEMRYSRKFRFFAGLLCWLSGIFNFGIFPAIFARFFIHFCGLPAEVLFLGFTLQMFPLIMFAYLSLAAGIACSGGQFSIMLTDFFLNLVSIFAAVLVLVFLVRTFRWDDLAAGLLLAPEGKSMINPFKTSQATNFNVWYFLIGLFSSIYSVQAWLGGTGYGTSARTPHEARMGSILTIPRNMIAWFCMILIPLSAYAVLHHPSFAATAAPVKEVLAQIVDPILRGQMTVPVYLVHLLPVGMVGLFAVIILAAAIASDDTYIHAWGSILIQDIVSPLRKKPLEPKQHLLYLRLSIIGVAVFSFLFSLFFPIRDFIYMYFALTGAIYLGGAGSVIIGGLYWKRGTTAAAWTALSVGTVLAFGGMLVQAFWATHFAPFLLGLWPAWAWALEHREKFPLTGQVIYFIAMISAVSSYVLVSLLGPRRIHDMDKLLHRGTYVVKDDVVLASPGPASAGSGNRLSSWIGITPEFSTSDRRIARFVFFWQMGWFAVFLAGTLLGILRPGWITDSLWVRFWYIRVMWVGSGMCVLCSIWLAIGGFRDAIRMVKGMKRKPGDEADDGFVSDRNRSAS